MKNKATGQRRESVTRLLLVTFSVLLGCLIIEAGLRINEPASDDYLLTASQLDDGMYITPVAGASGVLLGRKVSINADGYRGHRYPRQKPIGVTRVLFFGDSHTFSMGAAEESTYPAVVERFLSGDGHAAQSLNFGVPGQNLRQILIHARNNALQYQPDIVVITYHDGDLLEGGDVFLGQGNSARQGPIGAMRQLKITLLKHSYLARLVIPYVATLLKSWLNLDPGVTSAESREVLGSGQRWLDAEAKIIALKKSFEEHNIRTVVVLFPNMSDFENHPGRESHRAMKSQLKVNGIPTLELLPYFAGYNAKELTASLLDKHPNERGYEIAGLATGRFLAELLEDG